MPAQHRRARQLRKSPRTAADPVPGIGGYDYPRGPYGETGFPGSTPATLSRGRTGHSQGPGGRKDPSFQGRPTISKTGIEREWSRFASPSGLPFGPPPRTGEETAAERRSTPVIGGNPSVLPGRPKNLRNTIAQRWKGDPLKIREYQPAPNPGKTGARLTGPSRYHPGTTVHGDPDGTPVPGQLGTVTVQSRYASDQGAQEGYAMNRAELFTKGGTPPAIPRGAAPHIRGGRYSGERYFGAIIDQQRIGLDSDSYGIARRRGPRHRPVRFTAPGPWTANYYDVAPEQGSQAPDMIHNSPGAPARRARNTRNPRRK